jgi:hypothetical protein
MTVPDSANIRHGWSCRSGTSVAIGAARRIALPPPNATHYAAQPSEATGLLRVWRWMRERGYKSSASMN